MTFASPAWLAALPALALAALLARARRRDAAGPRAVGLPSVAGLRRGPVSARAVAARGLPWLGVAAAGALAVALARPQYGFEVTEAVTEGISIAMVIDTSSSMSALDLGADGGDGPRNRLDVVQRTFADFIEGTDELPGRGADLVSLVAFARYADTLTPPTLDHGTVLRLAGALEPVALPDEDGTAVGDAILAGLDTLSGAGGAGRVLLLLTDGSHNAGVAAPQVAAEAANALGVRVYAIGAGSRGLAEMPARAGESEGRRVQVFIDEFTLTRVAEATGGRYFRATDEEGLRRIYAEIDRLEKGRNVARHFQRNVDLYPWLLALALGLVLLRAAMDATLLRVAP